MRLRRCLAAPFVITVGLAPACGSQSAPSPTPPEGPATRYDQNGNQIGADAGVGTRTDAGAAVEPPDPDTLPDAPADGNGMVRTHDNGTCWYYVKIECPANATCNPPPPQQVKCQTER